MNLKFQLKECRTFSEPHDLAPTQTPTLFLFFSSQCGTPCIIHSRTQNNHITLCIQRKMQTIKDNRNMTPINVILIDKLSLINFGCKIKATFPLCAGLPRCANMRCDHLMYRCLLHINALSLLMSLPVCEVNIKLQINAAATYFLTFRYPLSFSQKKACTVQHCPYFI